MLSFRSKTTRLLPPSHTSNLIVRHMFLLFFLSKKEGFFEGYKEEKCKKLHHVTSHVNHWLKGAVPLDLICEIHNAYDLVSFTESEPFIERALKITIKIIKIHHNVTVINFNRSGFATLYFESVEDAANFNRNVYPPLKAKLVVITCLNFSLMSYTNFFRIWLTSCMLCLIIQLIQKIGQIDRVFTKNQDESPVPVATQYADFYYERKSAPIKFVIEVDNNPEPVLVFIQGEFKMTIDHEGDGYKTILKVGGDPIYKIHFYTSEGRKEFTDRIGDFISRGVLRIS